MSRRRLTCIWIVALAVASATGCPPEPPPTDQWQVVVDTPQAALLAVHGRSANDVWIVGADDGSGPMVLHFDGTRWERRDTGLRGDLWWVRAFPDGSVWFAGSDAMVVRYDEGTFQRIATPGLGKTVLFGLWGTGSNDLYAVGSSAGRNGLVWHYDGNGWRELALPEDVPLDAQNDLPSITKVWGTSTDDVWVVGGRGTVLRGNHRDGFERIPNASNALLFTVHGSPQGGRVVAVGGANQGVAFDLTDGVARPLELDAAPLLQGVWVTPDNVAWASGAFGLLYRAKPGGSWQEIDHGLNLMIESLHATWVDPAGGVWSVGGNVLTTALNAGVAIHNRKAPSFALSPAPPSPAECPEEFVDPAPERSIARRWNEQILGAIRRDTPRPTVHARNLFHTSAAMWDAWNAYRQGATAYLADESAMTDSGPHQEAISYAAYRVLTHRYTRAVGGEISTACFDAFMAKLGYDTDDDGTEGNSARAIGNRVGQAYIEAFADDGANEANDYQDPSGYSHAEPRMIVDLPGSFTEDPLVWQQLVLAEAETQNGIPEGSGVREYIGAHWGDVTPFAMKRPSPDAPYYPGDVPPLVLDDALIQATLEVIRRTSWLDPSTDTMIDISPGALGNNPLGTDDGTGHETNPTNGEAYAPILVKRHDFGRILSEFWADGPDSETPPGHWNTIANQVSESPELQRRVFGTGDILDELSWDLHLYFALNGALHDAAIAAWELKRQYVTARPITLIRTLGSLGQRTDPERGSFHPDGLPLEPGLIELVTEESAASGQRHAHLARYVGEVAVWSWRGEPGDRETQVGGHDWIRAKEWMPYQRRNFVTPAFPGYVSGHSTFSRAAAEVLAALTASTYFPGGYSEKTFNPGFLVFEAGPSSPITLRWGTFYDAADQAGQSRLWGGIHVSPDDFDGRIIGADIGVAAANLARTYFEGAAPPSSP